MPRTQRIPEDQKAFSLSHKCKYSWCFNLAPEGRSQCAECRAKEVARREKKRPLPTCSCGQPKTIGKRRCEACAAKLNAQNAEQRAAWRAAKICTNCGSEPSAPGRVVGPKCLERVAKWSRRPASVEQRRVYQLRQQFGLSVQEYDAMLAAQGGACAICRSTSPGRQNTTNFSVDHDHSTGKIRSLLCLHCNAGLGHFRDDPDLLAKAIGYLRRHTPPSAP